MSQLEIAQNSPTTYVFQYDAMGSVGAGGVAGKSSPSATNPIADFYPACSKIVGVKNVALGTILAAVPVYLTTAPVLAGAGPLPTITSSNAADTSVYAIYWTNQVAYSGNQTILPC